MARSASERRFIPEIIQRLCQVPATITTWSRGYRRIAVRRRTGGRATLAPQEGLNRDSSSDVAALASLGSDFVLDGELVALDSRENYDVN